MAKSVAECIMMELRDIVALCEHDSDPEHGTWKNWAASLESLAGNLWEEGHVSDTEHKAIIGLSGQLTGTTEKDFTYSEPKAWNAMRADGRRVVISGMLGATAEEAALMVDQALKGRPGGRHEQWEQWNREGRTMQEDTETPFVR